VVKKPENKVRRVQVSVYLSRDETDFIDAKAAGMGLSRAEMLYRAAVAYRG